MDTTTKLEFRPITKSRISSGRSPSDVRARVSHTSHQKRRLDLFLPARVLERLGWKVGGRVTPFAAPGGLIRLVPSHAGLKLSPASRKTTTVRVAVSGDFLRRGVCAPVRIVPHEASGSELTVSVPPEWFAILDSALADASGAV